MPGYPDVVIKDSIRIGGEFEIAEREIEEAKDTFGLAALANDPELKALEKKFSNLCYPFLEGFREVNKEFNAWFERRLAAEGEVEVE